MNVNNQMYNLFERMLQGYKNEDIGAVESSVHCWLMFNPENPFPYESEAYELFFKMQSCFTIWRRRDINARINKRRMLEWALKLCELSPEQPYVYDKQADEEERKAEQNKIEEQKRKEEQLAKEAKEKAEIEAANNDPRYVLLAVTKAYNENNKESFEQHVIHLMDITKQNPFKVDSEEHAKFNEMFECYNRKPTNMRRVFVVAKELCEIINNTKVEPETSKKVVNKQPQTVLGIIPENEKEKEKEKKSWFKFLHPWKREGE